MKITDMFRQNDRVKIKKLNREGIVIEGPTKASKYLVAVDSMQYWLGESDLETIDREVRPGTIHEVGPTIAGLASERIPREETPREAVARVQNDLRRFVESHGLEHLVVVNVASTEPPVDPTSLPEDIQRQRVRAWTAIKSGR